MINAPVVIGNFNGREVALPLSLSPPLISPCRTLEMDVKLPFSLSLSSSPIYSRSYCIVWREKERGERGERGREREVYYEREMYPYKHTLYGKLYRGWILFKDSQGDFCRPEGRYEITIKEYDRQRADSRVHADDPMQEFSVLQYVGDDHPNVSGQICCLCDPILSVYYSVMKYRGEELSHWVLGKENPPVGDSKGRYLFRQILNGLQHLQSIGICHRDLSVENLLYDSVTDTVSIIDFGMSLVLPRNPHTGDVYLIPAAGAVGKHRYTCPEIVSNQLPFDGFLSDHWNLGIILFLFLTKKYLLSDYGARPLCPYFRHLRDGKLRALLIHWNFTGPDGSMVSSEAADLLDQLIQATPHHRPNLNLIQTHPWVINGESIPLTSSEPNPPNLL